MIQISAIKQFSRYTNLYQDNLRASLLLEYVQIYDTHIHSKRPSSMIWSSVLPAGGLLILPLCILCRRRPSLGMYRPFRQKALVNKGAKTAAVTAIIPTAVSRKPQRLMLMTEGAPRRVSTARTIAVDMMKRPEQSKSDTPNLRRGEIRRLHRIGIGMARIAASDKTLRTTRTQKF